MRGALTWAALALLAGCGDDDDDDLAPCNGETCGPHEQCSRDVSPASCECELAYTGPECLDCAIGFAPASGDRCEPIPIDCDFVGICGAHGTCVDEGDVDRCECEENYVGPACGQCAEGFQDRDADGTCNATCQTYQEVLGNLCEEWQICEDASGMPECVCPPGTQGEECENCSSGWARLGDGPCFEVCSGGGVECPEGQHCWDDGESGAASCACAVGYAGQDCLECAEGFTQDEAGLCVFEVPARYSLLVNVWLEGSGTLAALDPMTGELLPMRTMSVRGLAWNPDEGVAYTIGSGIDRLDLDAGTHEALTEGLAVGHGPVLVYHLEDHALYTLESGDPYTLVRVDPQTGVLERIGPTGLSWIRGLAYAPQARVLWALESQGLSPSLHTIDPESGATVELGPIGFDADLPAPGYDGFAFSFDPITNDPVVLGATSLSNEQAAEANCRRAAFRMGLSGYEDAPAQVQYVYDSGGIERTLTAAGASGREILVYWSYQGTSTLRLEVTNPDAFVCAMTNEEDLQIVLPADTDFAAGVVYSYRGDLTVDVDRALPVRDQPLLYAHSYEGTPPSLAVRPDVVRVLWRQEWSDRRLDGVSSIDAPYGGEPRFLARIDAGTWEEIGRVELPSSVDLETLGPYPH